jgi:NAD(P)H-hydrate epimerase
MVDPIELELMDAAGKAIADVIELRWEKRPVAILCGPGKNGGDGFVVARLLKKAGWPVVVYLLGNKSTLTGEAAVQAKRWRGGVRPMDTALEDFMSTDSFADSLVVDAVFGVGLSRPLGGVVETLGQWLNAQRQHNNAPFVVAVDVPSGIDGQTGQALQGLSFQADLTVTFSKAKPGHLLMPGRKLCGALVEADIGLPLASQPILNTPQLWGHTFPRFGLDIYKYVRGHLVVVGGDQMMGAAHLAALAARRMGAGLVSLAIREDDFAIYSAAVSPGTLLAPFKGLKGFRKILSDPRKNACVIGPGAGLTGTTKKKVLAALKAQKSCVLDADALSIFQDDPVTLFQSIKQSGAEVVLTPHGGEFARLFADLAKKHQTLGKLEITRLAAQRSKCVVIYKGPDSVIAAPDGRAVITSNAPPTLATAGTGDVLAGFVGALLAQNMPAFEAALAATWLHGQCAQSFGPGLIAEDLISMLPEVLGELIEQLNGG